MSGIRRPQRPGFRRFGRAEHGSTAIEYALIGCLISVFVIGAMSLTGNGVKATYNILSNAMIEVVSN